MMPPQRSSSHIRTHLPPKILVSACLIGKRCSFKGNHHLDPAIRSLFDSGRAIAACPEELGGLGTPRQTSEIVGGDGSRVLAGKARVITRSQRDVTRQFVKGARMTLAIARDNKVRLAIFKTKSPSCGCGRIYDGTFSSRSKPGCGVTATLLLDRGIFVLNELDWERARRVSHRTFTDKHLKSYGK